MWVVKPDSTAERDVAVQHGARVQIQKGVAAGEAVVTDGVM